jgi:hypothetical protein
LEIRYKAIDGNKLHESLKSLSRARSFFNVLESQVRRRMMKKGIKLDGERVSERERKAIQHQLNFISQ